MPAGRPKIKPEDLPDNWANEMMDLALKGASEFELRATILQGMSSDLWYRLIKEEPEFSATIKKCKEASRVWWEKNGRENLKDREFNPTLWYMNMKNRFGWADKKEILQKNVDIKAEDLPTAKNEDLVKNLNEGN